MPHEKANEVMEDIKKEAIPIIRWMQRDIKESTRLTKEDFLHIIGKSRK